MRFSRSRGRYERQRILVEPAALGQAEQECLEHVDDRAKARATEVRKRRRTTRNWARPMIEDIGALLPRCPPGEVRGIAIHTAARRTAAGKSLDAGALIAAVTAAVLHKLTDYDELLASGVDRDLARARVAERVRSILDEWCA